MCVRIVSRLWLEFIVGWFTLGTSLDKKEWKRKEKKKKKVQRRETVVVRDTLSDWT